MRGPKISGCPVRSSPKFANSARMPIASSTPRPRPRVDPDETDHERLEQHRSGDLPLGRAQGPQERQLAAALRDQDRERVDDQERADHQRDAGEDQQEGTQEADRLEQVGGRLVGGRVAGDGLDVVRQPLGDVVAQLRLADAVVGRHPDVGEGVLALEEEVLRRRRVEGDEGRAVERAALGEVEDADQLRRQQRLVGGGDDVHLLADEVARPLGGLGVEDAPRRVRSAPGPAVSARPGRP